MRMTLLRKAVCLLVVAPALAIFAASTSDGPSGKWSGTVDVHDTGSGSVISTPIEVQFEEKKPGVVEGTIGRAGDNELVPIQNGKIEGNHLSFEASSPETAGSMKFTLTLNGDQMEGEMKGAVDTENITGVVKISRQRN